ncbi:serine carboxypeptidase-like 46 isoform X2 [Olea europaea var. sylvestris]|uniref:serine carboxypeptidase-like 46 isoform X2 n=1 Tax=Olea europaea var. sylvestris TaxID=158386 RepID=UPI000C1CD03E|nr:serine carboxypeptidase-like 46 isoform X2 [Olea europaea var. sylvestris]
MASLQCKTMALAIALALLLQVCFFTKVQSYSTLSSAEKVTQLPGQPQVSFQQFAGYVTVDQKKQRALFYYFVEAEVDPASKPLVLWLNGGPGCSSLGVGAFSENGPFRPSGNVLVRNEYSWNREANVLYLESPIGVGFSYSTDSSTYEGVNDKITARDNMVFLQKWFLKFPQYRNRSLYITGESYAGHYIPQLAEIMLQFNKKGNLFNLKGIAQVTETVDVCVEDETVNYLNRRDVQKALHARLVGVNRWLVCSNVLDYELLDLEIPIIPVVGRIIKAGIPVLVYSGDQDSVIPLTGSRTLVHRLAEELRLRTSTPYRVWFSGMQVGGWTQVYGNILSFATVRGASHEAPFSQPERSLVLFKAFLEGRPLPESF